MALSDIISYGLAGSVLAFLGFWAILVAFYTLLFTLEVGKFMIGRRTVSLQALLVGLVVGMLGLITVFVGVVI